MADRNRPETLFGVARSEYKIRTTNITFSKSDFTRTNQRDRPKFQEKIRKKRCMSPRINREGDICDSFVFRTRLGEESYSFPRQRKLLRDIWKTSERGRAKDVWIKQDVSHAPLRYLFEVCAVCLACNARSIKKKKIRWGKLPRYLWQLVSSVATALSYDSALNRRAFVTFGFEIKSPFRRQSIDDKTEWTENKIFGICNCNHSEKQSLQIMVERSNFFIKFLVQRYR